jgi:hypothetical protein
VANRSESGVALLDLPTKTKKHSDGEKRLNLVLSSVVFDDLARLAKERRTTMTEIVRLALGLIKVVVNETTQGHKLVVAKSNGEVLKELILPG